MNIVSSFFNNLAERQSGENDLSDITWTMCQTLPSFRDVWISFFFKELDCSTVQTIEREVYADDNLGSRVDFYIESSAEQMPYIIEVKIYDSQQHFGQYDEAFHVNPDHFGYITNYKLEWEGGYHIRQWKQFYDYLRESTVFTVEELPLVKAYLEYLKKVCNMGEIIEKVDLEKMRSLYDITRLFKQIVTLDSDEYTSVLYKDYSNDASKYTALQVKYIHHPEWGTVYPVIGVWFNPPGPRVCAGFFKDGGWGKPVFQYMKSKRTELKTVDTKWCGQPVLDEGYFFYLSDDALNEFTNASTVDEQRQILKDFLDEVISFPTKI